MTHSIVARLGYIGYLTPLISFGLLFYVWNTTNPASISPIGMLGVFVLLYVFWVSIFLITLHVIFLVFKRTTLFIFLMKKREGRPFHWRLAYYIASIIAFAPVLILAMQSVNQLSLRDILLVFIFVSLATFYVLKRA